MDHRQTRPDAGRLHDPSPGAKTFTSSKSLTLAHKLRKKADAILTGSGTILTDNPLFTVRHVRDHAHKRRMIAILDRRHRIPESWMETARQNGLIPLRYTSVEQATTDLTERGAQDILVEAGPALSQAILQSGLWEMSVTIHQAKPDDRIEQSFNTAHPLPFDPAAFRWEHFLPAE